MESSAHENLKILCPERKYLGPEAGGFADAKHPAPEGSSKASKSGRLRLTASPRDLRK